MKKKPEIRKAVRDHVMHSLWHGASLRASAKMAGIRPKLLRRYRRTHKIYDTRLKKLRAPYTLFNKFIKGGSM